MQRETFTKSTTTQKCNGTKTKVMGIIFYFITIEYITSWWQQSLNKFIFGCKQIKGNSSKTSLDSIAFTFLLHIYSVAISIN